MSVVALRGEILVTKIYGGWEGLERNREHRVPLFGHIGYLPERLVIFISFYSPSLEFRKS